MAKIKKWILYIGTLLLVITLGGVAFVVWSLGTAKTSTIGEITFRNELKIPKLLDYQLDNKDRKVFHLTFNKGEVEFLEGKITDTWGLNEPYLAPAIKASKGDEVLIHVTNDVGETTTPVLEIIRMKNILICTIAIY